MPHAALWVVQPVLLRHRMSASRFNAARGFVGGATQFRGIVRNLMRVSMPHAALWVVQPRSWCGRTSLRKVSMPHAALWVVQLRRSQLLSP